ncbi:MAG: galactose oxidase-like domain-containing protein [Planctomycetota bacterium]
MTMSAFPSLRSCILALALISPTIPAQNLAVVGQWGAPFALPLIAIHQALLPTGQVLLFSAEHGVPGIHGWLLDPATLQLVNVPPPAGWNPDCAGHSFLGDGRLLVAGGTQSFTPLLGTKRAYLFDPWSRQWSRIADMRDGRWYPTNLTLGDGSVVTMAGLSGTPQVQNVDIERWTPGGTGWQLLGQRLLPDYPLLHLLPDGRILKAGPDAMAESYDATTGTWTPIAARNQAARYEAPSILLPGLDRVMIMGGNDDGNGQPTRSVEILDLAAASPSWVTVAHMNYLRYEHNAVLLPNGKVLVIGGRSSSNSSNPQPVLTPELFDPSTGIWQSMAPHQIPRRYHSTAMLLPDGRVVAAGGDNQASAEIYSPPYLFAGPRPTITSAPQAISHGEQFGVAYSSATATNSLVLIRVSSVTHSINMGQRLVSLGQFGPGGAAVAVLAPPNGNVAPPGYYMLFAVDGNGVPSVARMVRVVSDYGAFVDLGNALAGTNGPPTLTGSGEQVGGGVVQMGLSNALSGSLAVLVLGFSRGDLPLLGGVLVPSPDLVSGTLAVNGSGQSLISITYPQGFPTGFDLYAQYWLLDAGAVQGLAASNALRARAP